MPTLLTGDLECRMGHFLSSTQKYLKTVAEEEDTENSIINIHT